MSGLYAVRAAAKLRRDLAIDVEMVHGRYGEYKVLVDGRTVIDGGPLTEARRIAVHAAVASAANLTRG